ncbi:MAG: hypothetical protein U1E20_13305 [Methylocystis sp.]|uniref:hypothetical protein n=1 Tax=Methylocystis sp. TaxID=1911079 RepID=UPI003920B3C0
MCKARRPESADARGGASCYRFDMEKPAVKPTSPIDEAAGEGQRDAQHSQAIEGDPLTAEEIAMFEMLERDWWSEEQEEADIAEMMRRQTAIKKTR